MYTFTAKDAARISKTVKTVERNPANLVGGAYKKPTVKAPPPLNGRFHGEVIAFWPDAYESHYGTREIPENWILCDGAGGATPNLVDKFVMGGTMDDAGDTGGTEEHTHNDGAIDLSHYHGISTIGQAQAGNQLDVPNTQTNMALSNSQEITTENHVPPYVKLCYIMYVGE